MENQAGIMSFLPLIAIFVVFYFLLIKPQQKKAKQQKEMIDNLKIGDEIVLTSGIICKIEEIPIDKEYIIFMLNNTSSVKIFKDVISGKFNEISSNSNNNKNKVKK